MAQVPPREPKYTPADLWPPGSKGENVEFPPAAFHPVYLDNFLCEEERQTVPARVQEYFAAKGLLARMVFMRSNANETNRHFQQQTQLYDCLVYFTREADALDAVKYLHRDKYYGNRLNIYPGRTPVVMNPRQTVTYEVSHPFQCMPPRFFEDHIMRRTKCVVKSIKRVSRKKIAVQYQGVAQMRRALTNYKYMVASPLEVNLSQHQSFLEKHVINEIQDCIKQTAFMDMCPETHVLEALYAGTKPNVPMDWTEDAPISLMTFDEPTDDFLFQVADTTLKRFGTSCNFALKPSQQNPRKRWAKLQQKAARHHAEYRHSYFKYINASYKTKTPDMEKLEVVELTEEEKMDKKYRRNYRKCVQKSNEFKSDSEDDFEYCL